MNDAEVLKRAEHEETQRRVSEYPALLTWQASAEKSEKKRCNPSDAAEDFGEDFSVHAR